MSVMFPPASTLLGILAVLVRAVLPAVVTAEMLADPVLMLLIELFIVVRLVFRWPN